MVSKPTISGNRITGSVSGIKVTEPAPNAMPERTITVPDPNHDLQFAAFTPRELDTLRSICRDSENELGTRFLKAALDRAVAK